MMHLQYTSSCVHCRARNERTAVGCGMRYNEPLQEPELQPNLGGGPVAPGSSLVIKKTVYTFRHEAAPKLYPVMSRWGLHIT